jgi:hypothetical protein
LACYAIGFTGTVAATNDPPPLRLFLESKLNSGAGPERLSGLVGRDRNENVENAEGVQELSLEVCRILELVSARRALEA